jgi:acylphosphatase
VEAVVQGTEAEVEELIARLKEEAVAARVRKVRVDWTEGEEEFRTFEVRGDF